MSPSKVTPPITARAYSYLRFSTPEQEQGDSRRRQTALADAYARRHGLTLDSDLRMEDRGVSAYRGANLDATAKLGAFLAAIRAGDVPSGSVLLIESLDRLSRKDARKAVRVLEDIVEGGVDVVTLNDGEKRYTKDSLDGFDFIMAVLILMRANEESKTKAKRVAEAWAAKRTRKSTNGYGRNVNALTSIVPGWIRLAADGTREAIPSRSAVVRRIFELFVGGTGQHAIAKTLNAENEAAKAAGKPPPVPCFGRAKYWHRSYINKMLRSPTVIGTMTPHTDDSVTRTPQAPIANYYPPVIERELWDRAQALVETNSKSPGAAAFKTRLAVQNILAGLAKCPECGGAMTRVWKGAKNGAPKLVCAFAKIGGVGCRYVSVSLPAIETALQRAARSPVPEADASVRDEIRNRTGELEGIESAIEELVDTIEKHQTPTLLKRLTAREEQRDRLAAELAALEKHSADSETKVFKRRLERYRAAMAAKPFNVAAANVALREMVTKVVVDYSEGLLRMHWRHDGESAIRYDAGAELVRLAK